MEIYKESKYFVCVHFALEARRAAKFVLCSIVNNAKSCQLVVNQQNFGKTAKAVFSN